MPFQQVFATALTDVWTTAADGDPVGSLRWEGNKCYKCVQYLEATAAVDGVAGEVAYYSGAAGDAALTGYVSHKVTSDLSDSISVGAGVLQAIMSDLEYGWVQIKGYALLTIALTAGADGDALTPVGAGDGTLDTAEGETETGSHICAYADDISAKEIICDFPF